MIFFGVWIQNMSTDLEVLQRQLQSEGFLHTFVWQDGRAFRADGPTRLPLFNWRKIGFENFAALRRDPRA